MRLSTGRGVLAWVVLGILAAGCASAGRPAPDGPVAGATEAGAGAQPPRGPGAIAGSASARPATVAPRGRDVVAPPPPVTPTPEPPLFAHEPSIAAAVARVERAQYERDLRAIVGDRSDLSAPAHQAEVSRLVQAELTRAGFTVRREAVRHANRTGDNLIAERAGSEPQRVIVVSAHLDTVPGSPGADDDGSGVAALLSIARAVATVPTRATVRVIAFAFEEDGLVGASSHVQALSAAERGRIVAVLDMDMIGYSDLRPGAQRYPPGIERIVHQPLPDTGDFIAAVGIDGEVVLPALLHARQYVPELRAGVVPLRRWQIFAAPDTMRGDHAPFWLAGVPAAEIGDTGDFRNPHYHQATDELSTLDLEFATRVARWVGAAALTLAGVAPPPASRPN